MSKGKLPISAFIICLNEADYLGDCIESLSSFAEVIIVDSGSDDGTLDLIQTYVDRGWPIRLYREPWRGYAGQKQFALDQCTQPWCMNIDADERLDEALTSLLPELVACDDVAGWRVARRPYLIGYGYTPENVYERRNLRLIRNGDGAYDLEQTVHEGIRADGKVASARRGSLLHYRPLPMDQQILKENKYSTLKAEMWLSKSGKGRAWKLVVNPPTYFLRLYVRNGLWRCGYPGFIEAMTGAVYSFLTEAKIYQGNILKKMRGKQFPGQMDV